MATEMTLRTLLGGATAARVLLFIENYGDGYASEIARTFDTSLSQVQKQLNKYEEGGILVRNKIGTTNIYTWNPRDPALGHLRALLRATLDDGLPTAAVQSYYRQRRRPRRTGKPL